MSAKSSSMDKTDEQTESLEKTVPGTRELDDIANLEKQEKMDEEEENQTHPDSARNWSKGKKWSAVICASGFAFVSSTSSSMLAPALPALGRDLNISSESDLQMVLSIYILAYAVGPLLIGPLSEAYGRVWVIQLSCTLFLIFNLACGFAQSYGQIVAFRFLSGIGGSGPQSIGVAILADCFSTEERGPSLRLYTLAPLLAPAIGPIITAFVVARTTWRWMFYALSTASGVIQILSVFLMPESWEPEILRRKAKKLQTKQQQQSKKEGGEEKDSPGPERSALSATIQKLRENLGRATKMLLTQPIIIMVTVYNAFLFGLSYLMLSTFSQLYTSPEYYDQSVEHGGLHYVALAIGYVFGTQVTSFCDDKLYKWLKARHNGNETPELRIPTMVPATILVPAGLFMYGWSAQTHTHWIVPDIGAFFVATGIMSAYYAVQRYLVDAYTKYAASAIAATIPLRSIAGFCFPLFAPAMYASLKYGWGNSLLAFVAIVFGMPAPVIFWLYGPKMRGKSRYAAG